jgi:molybdenum cofactor guanylyltransferase
MPNPDIEGWLLSGGQGRRMGGQDKGLLPWHGKPLAQHAAERLAPQVTRLFVNANRHLTAHAALGHSVVTDDPDLPPDCGPLVGMLTAWRHTHATWLQFLPCDYPLVPSDLVARLHQQAIRQQVNVAVPVTQSQGETRHHWACALVHRDLHASLHTLLHQGERRVRAWLTASTWCSVCFDDAEAFQNVNTPGDLA